MMDINRKQLVTEGLKLAAEAAVAFLVIVGVCWGLCNWAEHQTHRPIKANADGVISLTAAAATIAGGVERGPDDKEKQTSDFSYNFGRELLAERTSRTIHTWYGTAASAEWLFVIDPVAETPSADDPVAKDKEQSLYEVTVRLASGESSAGNRFTVAIANITNPDNPQVIEYFKSTVVFTGGMDKWKTISIGKAELAAGTYRLAISADGGIKGKNLMGLAGVELRPGE